MYIDVNTFRDRSSDAEMIQAAVDLGARTGAPVVIPRHNERTGADIWSIAHAIALDSGSVLLLQNCHLRLADGAVCNLFTNRNARTEWITKREGRQRHIRISGMGEAILDGGIHNGVYEDNGIARKVMKPTGHHASENCMVFFQNVEDVVIDHLTVRDQRYWGFYFFNASHGKVSDIRFESAGNVPNQDGVDLGTGCHDFIIENITGCVGDNVVALLATGSSIYCKDFENRRDGDIHNITIRNVMAYGVGGCALIRLLNHDGYRLYQVRIDNLIETSPWSETDAPVAQNPDLIIKTDENGELLPFRRITPGEIGYRTDSAIIIGESYWYAESKAQHGDTFGISVSNVMTHARAAVSVNNTLMDSSFDNIRIFGNGYMAAYMGQGQVENVRFSRIAYDKGTKPHKDDEHIYVEWNQTKTDGYAAVCLNGTRVSNVRFDDFDLNGTGLPAVFGGHGSGSIACSRVRWGAESAVCGLGQPDGITIQRE